MAATSIKKKRKRRVRKYTLESFPIYYVPQQSPPKQSFMKAIFQAHKFIISAMLSITILSGLRLWHAFSFIGLRQLLDWKHEIAALVLLSLTIYSWRVFFKWSRIRKINARTAKQKMELTAIKSKVVMMPANRAVEMPVYIASESLSIDYWVSRDTMHISDEDLAMGNLPDEYIAPDALVISLEKREYR